MRAKPTGFHCVIVPRWKSISIQSNIVRHLRDIPRDTHVAKIADYDDTVFGAGTLTVHPWRAGPDCGKFKFINLYPAISCPKSRKSFEVTYLSSDPFL